MDKTKHLNDLEKAYLLFNWIGNNIEYDYEGMLNNTSTCEINDVFKIGKTVCSGYSRLFRHFADNIDLMTENIFGYANIINTNSDSKKLEKRLDSNHEYNAVKLNNKWYLIDSTWGAGYISRGAFKKNYNPYYFCISPELLINSHFPLNENWQLLEKPLKDVFSLDVSTKYTSKHKNFNENLIKTILSKNNDDNIYGNTIKFLFEITLNDFIDLYTYKTDISSLAEKYNAVNIDHKIIRDKFHGVEHLLKKISEGNNQYYYSLFLLHIFNYKRWFVKLKGRNHKIKENKY